MKRLALVLTVLCSFSFVGSLDDGGLDQLSSRIAGVDRSYAEIVWKVYLQLSAEFNIKVYTASWNNLSSSSKSFLERELNLEMRSERVPTQYFYSTGLIDISGITESQLENQRTSLAKQRLASIPPVPSASSEWFDHISAPPEASTEEIAQFDDEVKELEARQKTPAWMQGVGGKS